MASAPDGRRGKHDPWWDLEGAAARRTRTRQRVVSGLAFIAALVACGGAAFAWAIRVGVVHGLTVT
jgi:uncharacterized membrane protein